jgi:hypothetical protein
VTPARKLRCPYGHIKQIARYCHDCKRLASRARYLNDPEAPDKKRTQREDKKAGKKPPRRAHAATKLDEKVAMSLLTNAPSDPTCEHKLAYAIADHKVHCYGCNAEWPQVSEVAETPPVAKKSRAKKAAGVGTESAGLPTAPGAALVPHTDVQDDGDGDTELATGEVSLPDTPTVEGSVPKTRRRGKKAEAAPEITEAPEYQDAGPWHDSIKCPEKSCFSKLQHHAPNIVNNGRTTYHYGCATCDDVRVVVHIGEIK